MIFTRRQLCLYLKLTDCRHTQFSISLGRMCSWQHYEVSIRMKCGFVYLLYKPVLHCTSVLLSGSSVRQSSKNLASLLCQLSKELLSSAGTPASNHLLSVLVWWHGILLWHISIIFFLWAESISIEMNLPSFKRTMGGNCWRSANDILHRMGERRSYLLKICWVISFILPVGTAFVGLLLWFLKCDYSGRGS